MASQDWFDKDFYAILGVAQDADQATIKKTYRKLAREFHPDSHPGDVAAENRFKEIGEAYAVLSDEEERQQYDGIRSMSRGGARFTSGGGGATGGEFEDVFSQMFGNSTGGRRTQAGFGSQQFGGQQFGGAQGVNIEDLLGGFAQGGGQAGFGGQQFGGTGFRGQPPGRDVEARASLSFRSAVLGDTVTVSGPNSERITAKIPAGVKDGQKIRLRGKGLPGEGGGPRGDMLLAITVQTHPVFSREGNNLILDLPVTFAEAALGATVSVPTLGGKPVKVKVAPGTPSGRTLRLKGRGVVTPKATGDLLARVSVVVPQRLTDEAKAAVEVLQAADDGFDPRAEVFARAIE